MDDEEAIHWAIRLDQERLSAEEQAGLESWLAGDERRKGSLLRAEAALAYLDRGRALAASVCPEEPGAARFGRRFFLVGGGALGGLCAAGLAGILLWPRSAVQNLQTVRGEVRRMPLADGSYASLNTDSRVSVAIGETQRRVRLEQGEAWFQVSHDRTRPFVVEAGDIRVRAVGTAFSVRLREGGADVLVTEGAVETWVAGRENGRTRIAAGARSFVSAAEPRVVVAQAPEAVDRALAWRVGEIALSGEPLSYAVDEINRYNERQLVIDDADLAREPLVGYFRTNDPDGFARAVASMVGARISSDGRTVHLDR